MKYFFTQSELAELVGVSPNILRYWEKSISPFKPRRRRGRKLYTRQDLKRALIIKKLLEKGYTLKAASRMLRENGTEEVIPEVYSTMIREIKDFLKELKVIVSEMKREIHESPDSRNNSGSY